MCGGGEGGTILNHSQGIVESTKPRQTGVGDSNSVANFLGKAQPREVGVALGCDKLSDTETSSPPAAVCGIAFQHAAVVGVDGAEAQGNVSSIRCGAAAGTSYGVFKHIEQQEALFQRLGVRSRQILDVLGALVRSRCGSAPRVTQQFFGTPGLFVDTSAVRPL